MDLMPTHSATRSMPTHGLRMVEPNSRTPVISRQPPIEVYEDQQRGISYGVQNYKNFSGSGGMRGCKICGLLRPTDLNGTCRQCRPVHSVSYKQVKSEHLTLCTRQGCANKVQTNTGLCAPCSENDKRNRQTRAAKQPSNAKYHAYN